MAGGCLRGAGERGVAEAVVAQFMGVDGTVGLGNVLVGLVEFEEVLQCRVCVVDDPGGCSHECE